MNARSRAPSGRTWWLVVLGFLGVAGLTVLLLSLLTNIFERKQEARQPFVRLVEVSENTMDPKVWGQNWPAQYDSYLKTSLPTATKYVGRGLGASDAGLAEQKLDRDPWLRRIFAGYAFALDYRDRRGHANRACQTCHAVPEKELKGRVLVIQDRHHELLQRAAVATTDLLDTIEAGPQGRRTGHRPPGRSRASAQGPVAARLRGGRELDGLPRAPGVGAHSGRDDRLRAPGQLTAARAARTP